MSDDKASEDADAEMLSLVRAWQDKHDLRPSELVRSLQRIIEIVKPKAWIAGWDAAVSHAPGNPYKRRDYARQFERGREAGKRQNDDDARVLKIRLERLRNHN